MLSMILTVVLLMGLILLKIQPVRATDMGKAQYLNTISVGIFHSSIITENGDLYTWGDNGFGQLGFGDTTNRNIPTKVSGLSNVVAVSASLYHSAAIIENGDLYTWGWNTWGQLGHGNTTNRNIPTKVSGLSNVVAVSLGTSHSAAITANGDLYTWGDNGSGRLGHGDTTNRNIPTKVSGLSNVVAVSLGISHSAAITANGDLYTWGYSGSGQLGHGDTTDRNIPTKVSGLSNVVAVSLSDGYNGAAITANGDIYTWGRNTWGQLGHGDTIDRNIPTKVSSLSNVIVVNLSETHSSAVTENGDIYTWGRNHYGQLGLGDTTDRSFPTKVLGLSNIMAVSLGAYYSAAMNVYGDLYTWGYNNSGQLGLGDYSNRSTPQYVMSGVKIPDPSGSTTITFSQDRYIGHIGEEIYISGIFSSTVIEPNDYTVKWTCDDPTAVNFGGMSVIGTADNAIISNAVTLNKEGIYTITVTAKDDLHIYAQVMLTLIISYKFEMGKDNFQFLNNDDINKEFSGFKENNFYPIYKEHLELLESVFNNQNEKLKRFENFRMSAWEGSCFGMSNAAILFYNNELNLSNWPSINGNEPKSTYELDYPINNPDIESLTNYYHLSQYLTTLNWKEYDREPYIVWAEDERYITDVDRENNKKLKKGLEDLIDMLKQNKCVAIDFGFEYWIELKNEEEINKYYDERLINSGNPKQVINNARNMEIDGFRNNKLISVKGYTLQHTIVAYDIKSLDEGGYNISIYDPNYVDNNLILYIDENYAYFTYEVGIQKIIELKNIDKKIYDVWGIETKGRTYIEYGVIGLNDSLHSIGVPNIEQNNTLNTKIDNNIYNNNGNVVLTTNNSKALGITNLNGMSSVILGMNIIGDLIAKKPKLYSSSSYYDIYLPSEDTYVVSYPSDINYDVMVMFQNSLIIAKGLSISSAVFNPTGIISIEGENTDFKLSMTFGEGYYNIPWHTIEISGENTNMASLERIGDNMLITCDNMQNIIVTGENNNETITLTFSTDKDQVLLRTEEDILVAYISSNDDGIFDTPIAVSKSKTYTITAIAGTGGTVSGGGKYLSGGMVTLTATPNTNYTFDGWYENGFKINSAGATYVFIATIDRTLEARFIYVGSSENNSLVGDWYIPRIAPGLNIIQASISETTVIFDKNNGEDIRITLLSGSYYLQNLKNKSQALVNGRDYVITGNEIIVKADYLKNLKSGEHTITFIMTGGYDPKLTITIISTTP